MLAGTMANVKFTQCPRYSVKLVECLPDVGDGKRLLYAYALYSFLFSLIIFLSHINFVKSTNSLLKKKFIFVQSKYYSFSILFVLYTNVFNRSIYFEGYHSEILGKIQMSILLI